MAIFNSYVKLPEGMYSSNGVHIKTFRPFPNSEGVWVQAGKSQKFIAFYVNDKRENDDDRPWDKMSFKFSR